MFDNFVHFVQEMYGKDKSKIFIPFVNSFFCILIIGRSNPIPPDSKVSFAVFSALLPEGCRQLLPGMIENFC